MLHADIATLVSGVDVIVCLESAVDMQFAEGFPSDDKLRVFATSEVERNGLEVIIVSKDVFMFKETESRDGIVYTSEKQTLLDLLEYASDVDVDILCEQLADWYFSHRESFSELTPLLNEAQRKAFEEWKQDAIEYYDM